VDNCNHQETKAQNWQGGNGTLKAPQKPVVLFVSHGAGNSYTTQEVEKFANSHFQKTNSHCAKLKSRYNFFASFEGTHQGVYFTARV